MHEILTRNNPIKENSKVCEVLTRNDLIKENSNSAEDTNVAK